MLLKRWLFGHHFGCKSTTFYWYMQVFRQKRWCFFSFSCVLALFTVIQYFKEHMVPQAGTKKILLMLSLCRVSGITQGYKSKSSTYRSMHWRFQSYPKIISCQTYCIDDWLVSNNIFMFACAKQSAAANRLQRYNKNLKYTK